MTNAFTELRQSTATDDDRFPFCVPSDRFDQRNELFKRRSWDAELWRSVGSFYTDVNCRDRHGYRKLDFALRNAAWSIESGFGFGTQSGNRGLFSWDYVSDRVKHYAETGDPVSHGPEANSRYVKKAARFFGAALVGVCYAHPSLIYSHEMDLVANVHHPIELPEGCTHAVVMAVEMDYGAMHYAADAITGAATGRGYSQLAVLANWMAAFIRGLGYRAVPSGNDTALSIPLAMAAGLGELGRLGLLVTEKYGPRVRLCKVFTDMPLAHDDYRPFGVADFCRACGKCATHCSAQAISSGEPTTKGPSPANHSGVRKWYIDPWKCYEFWGQNGVDCSRCIAVCPFNKPHGLLHDTVRYFVKRFPRLNPLWVWGHDVAGYGKQVAGRAEGFWESD